VTKAVRAAIQSFVLALGAFLVIKQEATGGVIIASSVLVARALAPVEMSIGGWKGFTQARQAWERLKKLLAFIQPDANKMQLPHPYKALTVAGVSVAAPGGDTFVVQNVTFQLQDGQALCIIGPSASGKSSLARLLTGGGSLLVVGFGWMRLHLINGVRSNSAGISGICRRT
jgi:ABC-type protease/lipase transport system fused ATPase/permease subunit